MKIGLFDVISPCGISSSKIVIKRNGVLFDNVSNPYLTVFLFPLDISWKFHKLFYFPVI